VQNLSEHITNTLAGPTVNFVWIGPPCFTKGGHDVVGPETLGENFKNFIDSPHNPMVFWCQQAHQEAYETYFKSKNIAITVKNIENHLQQSRHPQASTIFMHYQELTGDGRNNILDHVYMKDMFFYFLLASEGHYVLDTGVQANLDAPVKLTFHDAIKFPLLNKFSQYKNPKGYIEENIEVWMQYAPPHSNDANQFLERYLNEFSILRGQLAADNSLLYQSYHHDKIGDLASKPLKEFLEGKKIDEINRYTWYALEQSGVFVEITECGLCKEYRNTHRNQLYPEPKTFSYIRCKDLYKLSFALDHGESPLQTYSVNRIWGGNDRLIVTDKTLLHEATRFLRRVSEQGSKPMIEFLLKQKLDPNAVYYDYRRSDSDEDKKPRTALMNAIKGEAPAIVELLYQYGAKVQEADQEFFAQAYCDPLTSSAMKNVLEKFNLGEKYSDCDVMPIPEISQTDALFEKLHTNKTTSNIKERYLIEKQSSSSPEEEPQNTVSKKY
jgi:hypothetical protein